MERTKQKVLSCPGENAQDLFLSEKASGVLHQSTIRTYFSYLILK